MNNIPDINKVLEYLTHLQQNLQQQLSQLDGQSSFVDDAWQRPDDTGHGISSVLRDGAAFEQAGVNFSYIKGGSLPPAATAKRPELAGRHYEATGVSLVIHPWNPYVPTTHMNVRFFIAYHPTDEPIWWFGGGYDLTPYYGFDEDCTHWHQTAADACSPAGTEVYSKLKAWCDRYFYLPHRDEPRGIGGLFYDDWNEPDFESAFAHTQRIGDSFSSAYLPIVERRKDTPYSDKERQFQLYRRGRYVEFNLLFDRGTLFGIQSKGRTESILMSMPPNVRWEYGFTPEEGSAEEMLYSRYLTNRDWINQDL